MNTISILVDEATEPQSGTLGVLSSTTRLQEIEAEKIRQALSRLLG